ncbi:MAG: PilZ domain-containing protein [Desulfosalsimonadaceae bacterium]
MDCPDQMTREHREFSRHWVSFPVIVSWGEGFQNGTDHEKTVLKDISGGGALFVSRNPENYYPGQLLNISIMLDGTNDVRAQIRTEATVVRIHHDIKAGAQASEKQVAGIAVQFDRSFEFERIDNHDSGSIG